MAACYALFLVFYADPFTRVFRCYPGIIYKHFCHVSGDGLQAFCAVLFVVVFKRFVLSRVDGFHVFSSPFVVLCYTTAKFNSQFPKTFQKCTKKRVVMHILIVVNFL